jgi:putative oxidoreductase
MKCLVFATNVFVGLIFTVAGLNGFFAFFELPLMPPLATNFIDALIESGFMSVIKGFEVVLGLMILFGLQRPMAYVMLFPIAVGIALFDLFILKQMGAGLVLTLLITFLIWSKKELYFPMLKLA